MSSLDRRADALAADRTEPEPYPVHEDVREVVGRTSDETPRSGWGRPADRHALAGFRQRITLRPFGKHEQPYLTGQFVNLIRRPNRHEDESEQLPQYAARRSQPRNRPTMDEGLCR